ncbi:MAG: VCBS repeat-containing protein [Myxococcota bacterium]
MVARVPWLLGWLGLFGGPAFAQDHVESNQDSAEFGTAVASAGDVDGDGYDDVLVAAPEFSGAFTKEGAVALYRGSPTGIASSAAWTISGGDDYGYLGVSVAGAGDVNGDGFDDVIVGGPLDADGGALVYLGSATGLDPVPAWEGSSPYDGFGVSVASAGDVNGDGYDDVIIGQPYGYTSHVYIYLGSPTGPETSPSWTVWSPVPLSDFGQSVASAGDVNGEPFRA